MLAINTPERLPIKKFEVIWSVHHIEIFFCLVLSTVPLLQ